MVVGSALAGRNHRQTERLIGFFINTLVLRTNLGGNPRFPELLGRVRRTALEAFAHQDLPFEKLVEVLRPPRDVANTPLFQVAFGVQNAPEPHFTGDRLRITGMNLPAEDAVRPDRVGPRARGGPGPGRPVDGAGRPDPGADAPPMA